MAKEDNEVEDGVSLKKGNVFYIFKNAWDLWEHRDETNRYSGRASLEFGVVFGTVTFVLGLVIGILTGLFL